MWYRGQGLPEDGAAYVALLKEDLHVVTQQVARALPTKAGIARIEGDRLIVTPLDALPVSAEVVQARAALARCLPHPGLPDLLQEVDHWTGAVPVRLLLSKGANLCCYIRRNSKVIREVTTPIVVVPDQEQGVRDPEETTHASESPHQGFDEFVVNQLLRGDTACAGYLICSLQPA